MSLFHVNGTFLKLPLHLKEHSLKITVLEQMCHDLQTMSSIHRCLRMCVNYFDLQLSSHSIISIKKVV